MTADRTFLPSDIPEEELQEEFYRPAAGPGGQHVNRTANAVRLIFDVENTALLTEAAKARFRKLARASENGPAVIVCCETRSLAQNRALARERLAEWIAQARIEPRKRRKTKPTRASKEKRLKDKSRRGVIKAARSGRFGRDD